jgi:prepilin-type N-terminal cleavage/methylation domain-containing protein
MAYSSEKSSAGFTIAELLISLTIIALLLAAVAAALNASVANYRDNEDIFKTINNARQALTRITNQLRTADAVDPNEPSNQCSLITAGSDDITYRYDNSEKKLYVDFNSNSYVLCDNVTAMTFTKDTATEDSVTYVKSVQVSMTVSSGDLEKTLSAAAVVRRNLH